MFLHLITSTSFNSLQSCKRATQIYKISAELVRRETGKFVEKVLLKEAGEFVCVQITTSNRKTLFPVAAMGGLRGREWPRRDRGMQPGQGSRFCKTVKISSSNSIKFVVKLSYTLSE